jgi:uncharacterized protein YndB with AHSA1/START domain
MTVAPVLRAAHVRRDAPTAFALFTERIGAWWPLRTHGLFGHHAGTVELIDGAVVERAVDGRTVTWATVSVWEPPSRLVLAWHPGGDGSRASEVEVRFVPDADGTRIELEHRGWEAFGETALAHRQSYVGPNAWGYVLDHYADVADRSDPIAGIDVLAAAYDAFFAATAGPFAPPSPGEWTADEVVAHVLLNDGALSALCRSIIEGEADEFTNDTVQDRKALARAVDAAGGELVLLVARARAAASDYRTLLGRLDDEQLATDVTCRLTDHGRVVLDGTRPWRAIAVDAQAGFHLPLHTEQLLALRAPQT